MIGLVLFDNTSNHAIYDKYEVEQRKLTKYKVCFFRWTIKARQTIGHENVETYKNYILFLRLG